MKKLSLIVVLLSMSFIFSGCSKDPLSQQTIEEIDSIGEVELNDEDLIVDLEKTYSEMTDKQKDQVNNYVDLKNARKSLDILKEEESERIVESEKKAEEERQAQIEEIISKPPYSDAVALCSTLKDSLYNPESFQLHSVQYSDAVYDCYKVDYSGQNKLGGTVRNSLIAQFSEGSLVHIYEETDYEYKTKNQTDFEGKVNEVLDLDVEFISSYF